MKRQLRQREAVAETEARKVELKVQDKIKWYNLNVIKEAEIKRVKMAWLMMGCEPENG